jgi:uncharacterized membrane protein SpoIIM required for sporulation
MIDLFVAVFRIIDLQIFIISALLFFIGYAAAPTAYYKNIRWLTSYPFFVIKLMDRFFKTNRPAILIFTILFTLNSISLFVNLLSAWGVILPYLFVIYMGINIGVVIYHSLEGRHYYLGLINPVALIELLAAWLSISMSIQFSLTHFFDSPHLPQLEFSQYLTYFVYTILPLLFVAGIIETILIVMTGKTKGDEN